MRRFQKKVIQVPKISSGGILLHIAIIMFLVMVMAFVWDKMSESALKELTKVLIAIAMSFCLFHLVHRLLLNKTWFDENDPEYKTEYIELHDDHIVIYTRAPSYSGHHYSYGKIYFEDMDCTFIHNKEVSKVYKMSIRLSRNQSGKSFIKRGDGRNDNIFVAMKGYPEELSYLLLNEYSDLMNLI